MIKKIILFLFLFCFFGSVVSAFLISDQGTSVKNLSGSFLENGNLTIKIYNQENGGDLVFSLTTQGAIVNGSWNLMINPDLEYGSNYWKDYEINGEDVDFDGNERIVFQSSLGVINNVSFINFSLINSCSSGSAIRLIHSNGSVECEVLIQGGNVNLTNYALKNQSENFEGNITTSHTGFFGFLGSLANRITKLFVENIDVSGNIDVEGNVTSNYFVGDGSLLTNISSSNIESDPIFIAENSTLWNNINSKLAQTDQRYNETSLILFINTTSNIMSLGFYNSTQINSLLSSNGNLSFNQTLTDSIYSPITWNYNQSSAVFSYINLNEGSWISTFNLTYATFAYNQTSGAINYINDRYWNKTQVYNLTEINSLISLNGNLSFNQTLTDSLYYSVNNYLNFINLTQAIIYNDTLAILGVNSSIFNYINSNYGLWISTYNLTYNNLLNQQCPSGMVVNGTRSNGTILCVSLPTSSELDPQWSGNLTNGVSNDFNPLTSLVQSLGNSSKRWLKGWFVDLDVSRNISITGNASARFYFGSLNTSTFPTSSCSGTNKVVGINANGSVSCATDQTSGSSTLPVKFMNVLAGAVTDTNAPSSERIVGNSQYLVCTNTTGYSRFRYGYARASTNGASNAIVYIKYISSPANTITASSYTNLSNSTSQILSYTTANIANLSSYYSMDNNLEDVCLGAFQVGGDGTLDPQWRNIWIELS